MYKSHVNYIEHVQFKSLIFFCRNCCEKICKPRLQHIFDKKWRQVKPKRIQENDQTWIFFKIALLSMYSKIPTHSLLGAWSFFLVHIWFTPSEGPKAFQTIFSRSRTMEVGPWTHTIKKGHLPWSNFMVHSVNRPLVNISNFYFMDDFYVLWDFKHGLILFICVSYFYSISIELLKNWSHNIIK